MCGHRNSSGNISVKLTELERLSLENLERMLIYWTYYQRWLLLGISGKNVLG